MMNQEIKARWVAALRSGEYAQSKDCLNNGNGFCCLGVLSDLYAREHGVEWIPPREGKNHYTLSNDDEGREYYPSERVIEWAQLPGDKGNAPVMVPGLRKTVAELNDSGATFKWIADVIEAQL